MTGKQMSERLTAQLNTTETSISPKQIWNNSLSGELSGVFAVHHALSDYPFPRVYLDGVLQIPDAYRIVDGKPVFPQTLDSGSIVTVIEK
jgi:hypothetical protein